MQRLSSIGLIRRSKLPSLILSVTLVILSCSAAMGAPGENALDFLNLPISARSAALGQGDFAGIIGPEAIFGNPSLLGENISFFASHQELLLDTRSDAAAVTIGLGRGYAIGMAAFAFSPGPIAGYTSDNVKTGTVDAGDRLFRLALSTSGKISSGIAVSIYHQQLDDMAESGLGLGAGATIETRYGRFAFTADNIGSKFGVGNKSYPLPSRFTISGWFPLYANSLEINVDISHRYGPGIRGDIGVQYNPLNGLAIRMGSNNDDPLAMGFRFGSEKFSLDYSYVPLGNMGDKHILSVLFIK